MASSRPDSLTTFQREILHEFFLREQGFFLTGGAALAGWHLGHRPTDDLDLFTLDDGAFARARFVLEDIASKTGAVLLVTQDAPGFRRTVLTRGPDGVVVDVVRDRTTQRVAEKSVVDGIRIDPPAEIVANKLCALVGRAEERDLVDLWFLDRAGYAVEDALPAALAKDGGCTPATLAWLLSGITIPPDAVLPGGAPAGEVRRFVDDLVGRLRRLAHPGPP